VRRFEQKEPVCKIENFKFDPISSEDEFLEVLYCLKAERFKQSAVSLTVKSNKGRSR